jgi:hypothetical protein
LIIITTCSYLLLSYAGSLIIITTCSYLFNAAVNIGTTYRHMIGE